MPVCMQANEVAKQGSEITLTLHIGDLSLFEAVASALHPSDQRRQKITEVSAIPQQQILIGD